MTQKKLNLESSEPKETKKLTLQEIAYFEGFKRIGIDFPVKYEHRPIVLQMRLLAKDVLSEEYTDINKAKDLMENYIKKLENEDIYTLLKKEYYLN